MDDFCLENPINAINGRRARLIQLSRDDPRFAQIEKLFEQGWRHPTKVAPRLYAVYKIVSPEWNLLPYLKYKASVVPSNFWSPFIKSANESLLFHGTTRACLLGEDAQNVLLCGLSQCSLCTIIRESFDVGKCGRKNKFSRFGTGIYTSSCSSKADDYVTNASKEAGYRVLLLNRVILGRARKLRRNAVNLTGPPSGYDSVIGEPGGDLNYEETVVYKNDAIRPAYLLVYGDRGQLVHGLKASMRKIFTMPLAS